ncbi:hypothetical protein GUITHDRAFT_108652 [Guillardia theta CCMP2712]|uniref:Uncharacterized protein n=1 Tax=Guillardia theta (strain CCMP2712) TaxID=905079 RepID=L1JB91_GUITC|nr:hypothetical protein GUITHDRAFT_108652 [Guillardia theta CCMP2712]EKX45384.1 hypothetical protein GUITHDRAFT_108652 [Guillardia theta CCMP2712]|eukprot:XP_005832364.1 hypothetical protein GUITHDRAFT_108652 [Guillardia theta CCMP2712]
MQHQALLASLALMCLASPVDAFLPLSALPHVRGMQGTRATTCQPKLRMSGKVEEQVKVDLASYGKEEFLRQMTSSRTPAPTKKSLIEALRRMRESSEDQYMTFLKELLVEIDGVQDVKFAMTRWPIPLPSYRTKLGCLNRMITKMNEESQSTRERSLAVILRQLMDKGAWFLELEAIERSGKEATMEEMLSRTPEGLETPAYDVLASRSSWEVRQYEEFTVCSTNMSPAEGFRGFNALANYIFGGNQFPPVFATPSTTTLSHV